MMMKSQKYIPWQSTTWILGMTFLCGGIAVQGSIQEIPSGQVNLPCVGMPYAQQSEVLKWPKFKHKAAIDEACWVSIEELQTNWEKTIFIDVRGIKEKRLHPLQGIQEQSLHAIESINDTKYQPVVLIGTGFDQVILNQSCKKLREQGMDVAALAGGVRALVTQSFGLYSGIDTTQLTPQELVNGSAVIPWELVTFGLDEEQIAHLPQTPLARYNNRDIDLFKEQAVQNIKYVLIAPDEHTTNNLRLKLGSTPITNTVWLEGGFQAYENYIRQQYKIRLGATQPLIRSCGS